MVVVDESRIGEHELVGQGRVEDMHQVDRGDLGGKPSVHDRRIGHRIARRTPKLLAVVVQLVLHAVGDRQLGHLVDAVIAAYPELPRIHGIGVLLKEVAAVVLVRIHVRLREQLEQLHHVRVEQVNRHLTVREAGRGVLQAGVPRSGAKSVERGLAEIPIEHGRGGHEGLDTRP